MPDTQRRPHPERVSDAYAEERIAEKISLYDAERPREGLRRVDEHLKDSGVPPSVRLHYITALAHLGRRPAHEAGTRAALVAEDAGSGRGGP